MKKIITLVLVVLALVGCAPTATPAATPTPKAIVAPAVAPAVAPTATSIPEPKPTATAIPPYWNITEQDVVAVHLNLEEGWIGMEIRQECRTAILVGLSLANHEFLTFMGKRHGEINAPSPIYGGRTVFIFSWKLWDFHEDVRVEDITLAILHPVDGPEPEEWVFSLTPLTPCKGCERMWKTSNGQIVPEVFHSRG